MLLALALAQARSLASAAETDPWIVVDREPGFASTPVLAASPGGELFATWCSPAQGSIPASVRVLRSMNGGSTWEASTTLDDAVGASVWIHGHDAWLFAVENLATNERKFTARVSRDGGGSWSGPLDERSGALWVDLPPSYQALPVVESAGRVWQGFVRQRGEVEGDWDHPVVNVASAAVDADLEGAASWTWTGERELRDLGGCLQVYDAWAWSPYEIDLGLLLVDTSRHPFPSVRPWPIESPPCEAWPFSLSRLAARVCRDPDTGDSYALGGPVQRHGWLEPGWPHIASSCSEPSIVLRSTDGTSCWEARDTLVRGSAFEDPGWRAADWRIVGDDLLLVLVVDDAQRMQAVRTPVCSTLLFLRVPQFRERDATSRPWPAWRSPDR